MYLSRLGYHLTILWLGWHHKCMAPQKYVGRLGYHLTVLWLGWHHSSSGACLPHNFYTEICKAWCDMVRYGVLPTKLKNRHLALEQDLQWFRVVFLVRDERGDSDCSEIHDSIIHAVNVVWHIQVKELCSPFNSCPVWHSTVWYVKLWCDFAKSLKLCPPWWVHHNN